MAEDVMKRFRERCLQEAIERGLPEVTRCVLVSVCGQIADEARDVELSRMMFDAVTEALNDYGAAKRPHVPDYP